VVGVHDCDTLTLRVAGIDAPELKQPYSPQTKQALSALAFGKEALIDSPGPDKYGRTLGTVTVGAVNVSAELVK
jgi:endonuclease YncB( thermonuclease family)